MLKKLILLYMLIAILGIMVGCAGHLECQWHSEEEQQQQIIDEVVDKINDAISVTTKEVQQ